MILQALETLPSSSASCSRESFLLVLWESVVIWVLRIVGGLAITNLPRRPGWLRTDLTPCVVEAGSSQLSENYETSSLWLSKRDVGRVSTSASSSSSKSRPRKHPGSVREPRIRPSPFSL